MLQHVIWKLQSDPAVAIALNVLHNSVMLPHVCRAQSSCHVAAVALAAMGSGGDPQLRPKHGVKVRFSFRFLPLSGAHATFKVENGYGPLDCPKATTDS